MKKCCGSQKQNFYRKMDNKVAPKKPVGNISLSDTDKLSLIGNLNTMLTAGISLYEAVESLSEDAKGNQKKFLDVLRDDLVSGNHIYVTLSKFPRAFDKVTVNVIKASEEAGSLEVALEDLTVNIRKEMEFTGKIRTAMIYPTLILVIFLGVLLMILVVVIPKIATVFSNLKVELPLPTRILIFMSDAVLKNTIPLVGGIVVSVVAIIFVIKRYGYIIWPFFYGLPLISKLVREIDMTRFTRSLYLLLTAGIPITTALDLSKEVVKRKKMYEIVVKSRDMMLSGKKLSEGLSAYHSEFPAIVLKLIDVGEKSGTLPKSMHDISEFLDYRVSETLKTVTVLLEPIMLLFVGIFVGGMMMAIIAPIYGLIGQVGGR